jgi:hypothetical protein
MSTLSAHQVKQQYASEPWGKLLIKYGFEPYDTESSARSVARKAVEDITFLINTLDNLIQDGFLSDDDLEKLKQFQPFITHEL